MYLSFGEQVKIILKRKGMTIKELAAVMEERTGKKMSRQNLTQRLGRDNFQEKDMILIAEILERPLQLNILDEEAREDEAVIEKVKEKIERTRKKAETKKKQAAPSSEKKEVTEPVWEAAQKEIEKEIEKEAAKEESRKQEGVIHEPAADGTEKQNGSDKEILPAVQEPVKKEPAKKMFGWLTRRGRKQEEEKEAKEVKEAKPEMPAEELPESKEGKEDVADIPQPSDYPQKYQVEYAEALEEVLAGTEEEDLEKGEVNPYTGREYESNSVRIHPKRLGYVQVYSRRNHSWQDMTEWAFLGEQERLKAELGKDYEEPIFLD